MRDRGRLSRNPIALLLFLGLAEIGAAQVLFGPEGSVVLLSMQHTAQVTFAYVLLFSAILVLFGAAMPEPRAYWLEAGGKAGCTIALSVYTFTLQNTVDRPQTSLGFVFSTIAIGCFLRLIWLAWLIIGNFYPRTHMRLLTARAYIHLASLWAWRLIRARR